MQRTAARPALALAAISLVAAALFYLPFWVRAPSIAGVPFAHHGMERVYGMWDGPVYVTTAAALWDPNPANPLYAWLGAPPSDYAERFPLYPLLIRLVAPVLGYWKGALTVAVAASTGATVMIYLFLRAFGASPVAAFWVALFSIFWPPRGFLYRYVAMSDPLFILGVVGAAYCYKTERYLPAGLLGAVAIASRPNGFLVVAGFGLMALGRLASVPASRRLAELRRLSGLLLMPATLIAIYAWHQERFGDWLASLHASTFVRPVRALFPSMDFFGIGEEGVPYLFLLVAAGLVELTRRREWGLALLSALFIVPSVFLPTDVSRYLLPVLPFTFFLAGERLLTSVPLRVALVVSIPMIYVYAWKTMLAPGYQAPFLPLSTLLR